MDELLDRLRTERSNDPGESVCRGTLLSPTQYLIDVEQWGYHDARLPPFGHMTPEQIERARSNPSSSRPAESPTCCCSAAT
jgi:hypothetical protein